MIFGIKRWFFFLTIALAAPFLHANSAADGKLRGLPNVSFRTEVNSGNFDVFANFLAWFTSEETESIWANVLSIGENTSSFEANNIDFGWDYGFRVGAGYNFVYDQWDSQLYWTWFRTKATSRVASATDSIVLPEFESGLLNGKNARSASIQWSLLFDMLDCELGRKFFVSRGLALRPFIGLKGGWIRQPINLQYCGLVVAGSFSNNNGIEHLHNNFWGIGPSGGLNTQWKIRDFVTHFPSFFGDFSVATLWGTWSLKDKLQDSLGDVVTTRFKRLTLGAIMARGFAGLGWDVAFNRAKSHFSTRVGYEMQLWVNQLRLSTLQQIPLHGDLTLQGLTWDVRFDF